MTCRDCQREFHSTDKNTCLQCVQLRAAVEFTSPAVVEKIVRETNVALFLKQRRTQ